MVRTRRSLSRGRMEVVSRFVEHLDSTEREEVGGAGVEEDENDSDNGSDGGIPTGLLGAGRAPQRADACLMDLVQIDGTERDYYALDPGVGPRSLREPQTVQKPQHISNRSMSMNHPGNTASQITSPAYLPFLLARTFPDISERDPGVDSTMPLVSTESSEREDHATKRSSTKVYEDASTKTPMKKADCSKKAGVGWYEDDPEKATLTAPGHLTAHFSTLQSILLRKRNARAKSQAKQSSDISVDAGPVPSDFLAEDIPASREAETMGGSHNIYGHPVANRSSSSLAVTEVESIDSSEYELPYTGYAKEFISSRGNEYFCEIDEDYLTDRFNLTGLNTDVQYYQYALDLVTDVFDLDCDDEMREQIEKSARHLYGLVHARYITTTRGLSKMLDKYKKGDFGKCPRVDCKAAHLLPTGMVDIPNTQLVKLYCAKCEDIYNPKSSRHSTIDGAYFGSSFQNILFQVYPALVPEKSIARYQPKVFGFKVHAAAALQRWQDSKREEMLGKLKMNGIENPFSAVVDSVDGEMDEDEEEGEGGEGDGMDIGNDAVGNQ